MNRKTIMTGILCFVTFLCIGCGKKEEIEDKKEPVATSTGEAISTATPVATLAPVVEKGSIYVEKNTHKRQGVYKGKNQNEDIALYVHRVAGENLWFSFEEWHKTYQHRWEECYIRATKTTENSYEFHYDTWNSQDGTMKWDGDIVFKGEKVLFNIGCEEDLAPSHYELKRKNIKNADTSVSVIELARCLNKSYRKVKEELSGKEPSIFNIGKEIGRDRISYIEIGADGDEKLDKNLGYYQIKGMGVWGTKEECKKILGTPTEEHTYELRYETEDGYEIWFSFYHDYVKKMGIYFGSKKEALEEKAE